METMTILQKAVATAAFALIAAAPIVGIVSPDAQAAPKPKPPVTSTSPTPTLTPTPTTAPTPTPTQTTQAPTASERILAKAQSHVGEGPELIMTQQQIIDNVAWCSEFASYVATEAGAANLFTLGTPGTAVNTSTNRWHNWAVNTGNLVWTDATLKADGTAPNTLDLSIVKPGDIVLMWHWKTSTNAWSSHTAIVEKVAPNSAGKLTIYTIDGNWSDDHIVRRTLNSDAKGKIFTVVRIK